MIIVKHYPFLNFPIACHTLLHRSVITETGSVSSSSSPVQIKDACETNALFGLKTRPRRIVISV